MMRCARIAAAVRLLAVAVLGFAGQANCAPARQPLISQSEIMTVSELRPGMKGVGKSVFSGTRIEPFRVTVLGVLRKVDFSGDIILISIDSGPPVTRGYGVIAGMSGSPIYVKGKLIGALAYAWSFSKKPIAGVTPIAQMLEAYQPGGSPKPVSGSLKPTRPLRIGGQRVERAVVLPSSGTVAPAAGGGTATLVPIATPLLVSGGSPAMIARLRTALEPRGIVPVAGAGARAIAKARIEPGAAVGARLVGGDLDLTAVGTVTYVKDGVVLAFGHPFLGLGTTDVPLTAAYVHGIMPSSELSFKLASGGQAMGRFTEDRASCIGGKLGGKSSLIESTLRVSDQDRNCARSYRVQVIRNRGLTAMLLSILLGGAVESIGPPTEGTSRMRLALQAGSLPPIRRENTYSMEGGGDLLSLLFGSWGGAMSPTDELSQILEVLQDNDFGEAKVSRLEVAVELSKERRVAKVERVFAPRRTVKPGDEVPVEITLRVAERGLVTRTEKVTVPAHCPPGRLRIGIAGGSSSDDLRGRLEVSDPKPESLAQMVDQMVRRPRNNDLVLFIALPTVGVETRGLVFRDLPPAVIEVIRAARSTRMRTLRDHAEQRAETDWVLSGHAVISLTVEGDQKDKGGRPPSPEYAPSMFEGFGSPFAGLFSSLESEARRARASVGGEVMEEGELGADEEGDSAGEEAELEESDLPEMPSWEEVSSAGERELDENGTPASSGSGSQNRGGGGGLGRTASVWRVNDPKEMAKGKCVGVAQFNTGAVMLAPQMSAVAGLVERCLWSVAVGGDGSVYVGAWADGRLRRMAPDGTVTTVLETPDAVVQAVVVGGDGAVYAATGPSGTIYRIPPERGPAAGRTHGTVLCRLDAQNVWALALDQSDNLWAATGPKGKLYRISITEAGVGTPALQFTAPDRHLTALALAGDGTVYCGTSPLGKVYAVAPDGAVRSVFEVAKATVQSLAVGPDGSVYVGTSPDGRVLKIGPEGAAREVLKTKGRHVLALRAAAGGSVYAVSGPEARIYVVQDDTTWCELPRVESDYVVGMAPGSDGSWYLTAPDTGRLIRLDMSTEGKGSYTSAVRDAGAMARWGAVRRRGESPAESRMSIWTRTGMTAYPDGTWSEWQEVEEGVTSPPGRYLQARVDLSGGTRTPPRMDNLEISYLPANRAPEVSVTAPGPNAMWSGKQTIRWSGKDPDGDKLAYEVSYSVDDGATWTKIEAPAKPKEKEQPKATEGGAQGADKPTEAKPAGSASPRPEPGDQRGEAAPAQGARWPGAQPTAVKPPLGRTTPGDAEPEAGEPEESEEPGEGEEARTEAEPPRPASANRATTLSWDTATAPDGLHRIKVVASDKEADPLNPRTGEAISQSFTVDNTPPGFTLDPTRREDGPPPESVLVWDKTTYVTNVEIRVDQGEWSPVAARDGILDSASETVAIAVEQLPGGAHQLEMRARDAAGNVGTVTLRYKR